MITFQTYFTESECKEIWDEYSPKKHLWDLWEFRHAFHTKEFQYNFLICFDSGEEVGMIPLVFDSKSRMYTYFGDMFPERNKIFVDDPMYVEELLGECPYYTSIYYLDNTEAKNYDYFEKGDKRYFLKLKNFSSFEDYVGTFTKKHRKNLLYDLKKIKEKGITVSKNKTEDFEQMAEFNKQRFGKDSDYNDPEFVKSMKKLITVSQKKKILDMISIQVDSKTEAVGLGVHFKGIYYVLNSGRNVDFKNIGKLLIAEQIKSALKLGCKEIDFLSTEAAWKDLWNLESEQTYEYYC